MEPGWLLFIAAVIAVAVAAAALANTWRGSSHPPVDVSRLEMRGGLVVFTSADCSDCKLVIEQIRSRDVAVREVTYELESGVFAGAGVTGVPVTVGVDPRGDRVGQIAGVPRRGALDRLIRRTAG